jgi:hypothetical protein
MVKKAKLWPMLDGAFWLIGASPDLAELMPDGQIASEAVGAPRHECVDHHIFQSADGAWHLWGCVRKTPVGRILYHWEAQSLTQSPWQHTGEIIRVDRQAGESLDDWHSEEWIQSPYVVHHAGIYYMFYGGHGTGVDARGNLVPRGDPRMACQICLMTSVDGRQWTRRRNEEGYSRLFLGPGETRDPCAIEIDGLWHMYYAGYHGDDPGEAGFYVRTSTDLLHWSDWRLVHQDRRYGGGPWDTECPHVVFRAGYYYLFRTEDYASARTHVFRSEDPLDFGVGDASDMYVGTIAVAAPEIVVDCDGAEYITSNHDLRGGTRLCKLKWDYVRGGQDGR